MSIKNLLTPYALQRKTQTLSLWNNPDWKSICKKLEKEKFIWDTNDTYELEEKLNNGYSWQKEFGYTKSGYFVTIYISPKNIVASIDYDNGMSPSLSRKTFSDLNSFNQAYKLILSQSTVIDSIEEFKNPLYCSNESYWKEICELLPSHNYEFNWIKNESLHLDKRKYPYCWFNIIKDENDNSIYIYIGLNENEGVISIEENYPDGSNRTYKTLTFNNEKSFELAYSLMLAK